MNAKRLLMVSLALLITACTGARMDKFELTERAYERAIRWSDFKTAFALVHQPDEVPPDFQRLQNVRVTSYDKLGPPQADPDGQRVVQMVEIRYVNVGNMSERTLTERQQWAYVDKEDRWRLTTPFPAFR